MCVVGYGDRMDAIGRVAVASAPDAIVVVDRDLTVLLWNAAAERLFGWSATEIIGRRASIIPDELMAEHNAVLERVRAGGQISLLTRRFRRDGELVDVRVDTSALRDDKGGVLGWVSVYLPVEQDGATQHHLAERVRLVRRLGDVVADINEELELSKVLDRIAASLTELTGADAGGFVLIEDDRLRLVSMDGLPESLRGATADLHTSLVGELLRTGKTVMLVTGESGRLSELIWSRLPGLHTIALGIATVAGRPYGALYALFSKRKAGHIELELLELLAGHASIALANAVSYADAVRQRAHERAVIDASADGIAVLDDADRVQQWNPAAHELTGLPAADVIGKPPPFPLPEAGQHLIHQLPSGRWIEVLCAEIAETGETVVDFRDITEAKELEDAKDLFLATTSHELRTPITVVHGFARTLADQWERLTHDERHAAVRTIAERAGSLSRLVEHLLLGARAGREQLTVVREPFALNRLLIGATEAFKPLSQLHTVEVDVPEDLPRARGDAIGTDIIISQLLENAFKYSPEGGRVFVRAWPEGDRVVVVVEDEGVGIAPEDQERIFDRFVQGDAGDRRRFGGIGLGLFIVRKLARAQGGDISAHSRDGGGACFRLVLPRA